MNAESVVYELSLKDLLTHKLHGANEAAEKLEGTMERIEQAAGMLGVAFGIYEMGEYIKEAGEKWEQFEQARAKTEANLEATGEKAGVSMDNLAEWASELRSKTGESMATLTDMQSQLLTFPTITKDNFQAAMSQVEDIAKQTNHGVTETAIMYGKALADPAEGLQKLQRYGVILTQTEKDRITQIEATNGKVAAQRALMESIAQSGYEGVAAKMFDANPMNRYTVMMEDAQMEVGNMVNELKKGLAPALIWVAQKFTAVVHGIKDFAKWIHKGSSGARAFEVVAGTVIAALTAYAAVEAVVVLGTGLWTAAQWALNFALTANPIGLIIAGIAAFVAAIYLAYEKVSWFHAGLWGIWATMKEFASVVTDLFTGLYHHIHGIITLNPDEIKSGFVQAEQTIFNSAQRLGGAFKKGYADGMADFNAHQIDEHKQAKPIGIKGAKGEPGSDMEPSKASPNKAVTINISINKLIETFKISTTNLQESTSKVRELVTNTILQAVNDSSLTADI
jgi:hypothetical protein